ncbi:uncharacterized protein LOC127777165 isoform X1 [Oryza glaberrima]|uniref:uncharacterized protein LOC127777165 isoform X1 n=1 Tax=Oryza glaberrima TaxID=4538 RepID=UPI00224C363E|nr:uncharacterized protein LOC127777165 isoform X1 [Oryza glaberrima]
MVKVSAIHRTPPPLSWDFGRTGGAAAAAPRPRYKRALPMASPATATASLCCRLVRLPLLVPYARRRSPLSTRCSAAQSPDAVDREYADLNLRPLYPNVRPLLPPPGLPSLPPQVERERHPSHRSLLVVHAEGPSPAHPAARQPAQLLFLGAHGATGVEGGVRGSPAATHGRHWLREREVLDLACQELRRKAKLPRPGDSAEGFCCSELVERSQFWVTELGLRNVYFMFANATVSFNQIVSSYPGPLSLVSILCPDPHFKKRHHKRRVLQSQLVDSITNNLCLGGRVLLQSDVLEVAADMRERFDEYSDVFEHVDCIDKDLRCDNEGWLLDNPMGIRTEREVHAELEGATIYRRMYQKTRVVSH